MVFYPEDGEGGFFQNTDSYLPNGIPEDSNPHELVSQQEMTNWLIKGSSPQPVFPIQKLKVSLNQSAEFWSFDNEVF